jgi:hypothetical protein
MLGKEKRFRGHHGGEKGEVKGGKEKRTFSIPFGTGVAFSLKNIFLNYSF